MKKNNDISEERFNFEMTLLIVVIQSIFFLIEILT
jgi:hypothetical protein